MVTIAAEDLGPKAHRTRRNILKISAIFVPAVLAKVASARAHPVSQCFMKGTKIETAKGDCKVEDLVIGDLLPTKFGGTRPIEWIGRYLIKKGDPSKPWVKDALPVRIARSALGPNIPRADLCVTAGHGLLIDGALVPAEMLINGATIERLEARECDELEFFHVKLESHDVIYAEGAPVETLMNVDERAVNFADYFRRYGTPQAREASCAPAVCVGGRGEMKSRIRSAISPWLDRRERADVVRDRLEERGLAAFSSIGARD